MQVAAQLLQHGCEERDSEPEQAQYGLKMGEGFCMQVAAQLLQRARPHITALEAFRFLREW
jgi:hypothetical protein